MKRIAGYAVMVFIVAMGLVAVLRNQRGSGRVEAEKRTFANWKDFERNAPTLSRRGQVVFVGIDGCPWHFLDKLIDSGELPNLARMKHEGAYATLRSTLNYVTPPAWTAIFTGYGPKKNGIYTFGKYVRETKEFLSENSDDVLVPFVWDAASRSGLKCAAINVPMTFPAHEINGIMVTGIMTPIEAESAIPVTACRDPSMQKFFRLDKSIINRSKPMLAAVEDAYNVFLWGLHDTTDDHKRNYDKVSLRVLSKAIADKDSPETGFYTFDLGGYSPWLEIRYAKEGERPQKAYTKMKLNLEGGERYEVEFGQTLLPIEGEYTYPDDLKDELLDQFGYYLPTKFLSKTIVPSLTRDMAGYLSYFYDYDDWDLFCFVFTQSDNMHHLVGFDDQAAEVYKTIDRAIGEIMERMPAGSTLLVGSDHGNGTYEYGVDLNQYFAELGLLRFDSPTRIDHENTVVFHNLWYLYFNPDLLTRDELSKRGIDVPPGEDPREYMVRYMIQVGRNLKTAERGFPVDFLPMAPEARGDTPDMAVVGSYDDYIVEFWNIMKPHSAAVGELKGGDRFWHIRDGVFLAWGDQVRRNFDAGIREAPDVAPTILYRLGLPVGADMDGQAMLDVFDPALVESLPLLVNERYTDIPKKTILDKDERESLRKKLRSLGYVQ